MIRQVQGCDYNELLDLVLEERDELNRNAYEAFELAGILACPREGDATWLYTLDGDIIGFAAITRGQKDSDRHVGTLRIHLMRGYRGNRRGSKLLSAALQWADNVGIRRVVATPYIDTDARGLPTVETAGKVQFFIKHGFQREGVMQGAVRLRSDDTLADVLLMARTLPEAADALAA